MKKRLLSLALCLLMILSVALVGCKQDEDAENEITTKASEKAKTLTMWVVSEKAVDPETASEVSAALNAISKSKFKTNLVVNFLTEDVYRATLSETIRANEDARNYLLSKAPVDAGEEETTAEDESMAEETETNEYGQVVIKYPELKPNQVDIIYIQGYDMYAEYINNGWLYQLDSELSASAKKIKEYVSSTLLNAAKLNGGTYAIPNNSAIGEYTYMLLDKDLMDETFMDGIYKQGKINGMFNDYIFNYLDTVRAHHPEVVPVESTYDECLNMLAHYWLIDPVTYEAVEDTFSFLGYRYTDPKTLSKGQTVLSFDSLFSDPVFCENFLKLNEYRMQSGFFVSEVADTQKAAIRFCTGSLSDYDSLCEKYYPVIVKYPTVNIEDVYSDMFGVCQYSVDQGRSMQILTYLTSNADFRNILQYGVEGKHYHLVEDSNGVARVERLDEESYIMDIFKTGNAFIAYPEPTMDANIWELGKQQNREAKIEPLLNFDFAKIAKATVSSSSGSPKVGPSGYTYSYTTGYSKDVLSENAQLAKWFEKCDAAGKGVYVLHTSSLSSQNLTGMIYYYNNNISNAKVTVTDADGAVNVNYSGTQGNGYEITAISFYGKKNSSILKWNASVNGTAVQSSVTYQNSVINFDFSHTANFSVDLASALTNGMVCDNKVVWRWVRECTGANPFVGTYEKISGDTKIYTYVFYLPTITNPYSVTALTTGDVNTLNIALNYTTDTGSKLSSGAPTYAMFLLTVKASATTQINIDLKMNGNAAGNVTESTFSKDPEFAKCGQLDTEQVTYMYHVNEKINAIIADCSTMDELRTVVADLKILLTPQKQPFDMDAVDSLVVAKLKSTGVKELVDTLNLDTFYWYLATATSKSDITHKTYDENEKVIDVAKNPLTGEAYTYYKSPYMLYYAWLKSNGYAK